MIKKIFHLILALAFPFFVFIQMILLILFTKDGIGDDWVPESDSILRILIGTAK